MEWNTVKDHYDKNNTDEDKSVATFNSAYWGEGGNSPDIYTIPWDRTVFEKLLAHSKDVMPALAIKNLSNKRAYGVKSVQDFCVEDKDLAELVKSYEEPKPTFAFNIDPKKLTEFMKFQQAKEQTGEDHFQ